MAKDRIHLTYKCPQDVHAMPKTSCGHFCTGCEKEVFDFTAYTNSEIERFKEIHGPSCGVYRAEQVDPDLIAPISLGRRLKVAALFAGIFFGTSNGAFGQNTVDPKMEQSQGNSNAPNKSSGEIQESISEGQHVSMSQGTPVDESSVSEEDEPLTKKELRQHKRARKQYYRSRKAPFVRRSRRHVYGF